MALEAHLSLSTLVSGRSIHHLKSASTSGMHKLRTLQRTYPYKLSAEYVALGLHLHVSPNQSNLLPQVITVQVDSDAGALARIGLVHCDTEALISSIDSIGRGEYSAAYGL